MFVLGLNERKQSVYGGAAILMFGGILVKIIGAMFKIPLQNLIGSAGSAYFGVAYDIYTWMYILTTAGLPVAISRMVSSCNAKGEYQNSRRILNVAFISFLSFGVVASVFMFFGAGTLANLLKSPDSKYAIMAIAPSLMFEVAMSCYRGYNQGHKNMIPTAVSQIVVAVVKLAVGYVIAWQITVHMKGSDLAVPLAAAGAIFGVTLGTMFGSVYLAISSRKIIKNKTDNASTPPSSKGSLFRKLIAISVPIMIGSSVLSVTNLVDTAMLFRRLISAGFTQLQADTMYGYYGWARTMFNLPTAVIVPLGIAVVPAIAELITLKKRDEAHNMVNSTLRVASIMSVPAGMGLAVLSAPILTLIYSKQINDARLAAPLLTMLGPAVVLVCLVSITNALLQAIGKERVPIITMLIGGVAKIICNYTLVGIPGINIYGAPVGTNLCYGLIAVLNVIVLAKTIGKGINIYSVFIKPIIASTVACTAAYFTYRLMHSFTSNLISTAAAIGVAGILYLIFVLAFKIIRREDVKLLPKGEKIEKILDKYRLIG